MVIVITTRNTVYSIQNDERKFCDLKELRARPAYNPGVYCTFLACKATRYFMTPVDGRLLFGDTAETLDQFMQ